MENGLKILVVEDERFWFELLKLEAAYSELPMSLKWVSNGKEAVEEIEAGHQYDVIVMNLEMPVMHGITAARCIRDLNNTTPIVAWTCHDKDFKEADCLAAGMDGFIEKSGACLFSELMQWCQNIPTRLTEAL